jgi:hypothetical protein
MVVDSPCVAFDIMLLPQQLDDNFGVARESLEEKYEGARA